jgi:hypothetical protein
LRSGVGGGGVDDGLSGDDVGREAGFISMAPDQVFTGRDVDAEELICGYLGLDPLDLGADVSESGAGLLRGRSELLRGEFARAWDVAFNEKFRHLYSFGVRVWGPAFSAVCLKSIFIPALGMSRELSDCDASTAVSLCCDGRED